MGDQFPSPKNQSLIFFIPKLGWPQIPIPISAFLVDSNSKF